MDPCRQPEHEAALVGDVDVPRAHAHGGPAREPACGVHSLRACGAMNDSVPVGCCFLEDADATRQRLDDGDLDERAVFLTGLEETAAAAGFFTAAEETMEGTKRLVKEGTREDGYVTPQNFKKIEFC